MQNFGSMMNDVYETEFKNMEKKPDGKKIMYKGGVPVQNQQQEYNQFRTRKMSLPKGGINLGAIQLKNKILLNILHKRKQNK